MISGLWKPRAQNNDNDHPKITGKRYVDKLIQKKHLFLLILRLL